MNVRAGIYIQLLTACVHVCEHVCARLCFSMRVCVCLQANLSFGHIVVLSLDTRQAAPDDS